MIGKPVSVFGFLEHRGGCAACVICNAHNLKLNYPLKLNDPVVLESLQPDISRNPEQKLRSTHKAQAAASPHVQQSNG